MSDNEILCATNPTLQNNCEHPKSTKCANPKLLCPTLVEPPKMAKSPWVKRVVLTPPRMCTFGSPRDSRYKKG